MDKVEEKPIEAVEAAPVEVEKPAFGKRSGTDLLIDASIWFVLTAYFIAISVLSFNKGGYSFAAVVYVFISLRLLARHVSMSKLVYTPIGRVFGGQSRFPQHYKTGALFAITFVLILLTAFITPLAPGVSITSRLQAIAGIVALLVVMYALSTDRAAIPWHTVASGLLIQYLIAMFVLKTQIGQDIFNFLSNFIAHFLGFSADGLTFIIGKFTPNNFAVNVLPAIVFFCSFISIVYYFGGMQYLVAKLAFAFVHLMDTSGAESVIACASPFVGQGESALLVSPFVQYMTISELHSTMVSGFATIAGSVFIFYVTVVRDPKTILCCCVMSVPAGLLLSKMRYPEKETSISKGQVSIPEGEEKEANFLHAATNGSATGVQIVLLIVGSLLSIISLFSAWDAFLGWAFGMINVYDWTVSGQAPVSTGLLLSYLFAPVAWFIGIQGNEIRAAGALMATKMIVNEFVAYLDLSTAITNHALSDRTADLLAFALCGFANIASIGIQIGALGTMAPSRTKDLSRIAVSAMLTGTAATWLCSMVAGAVL
ncbi:hypothetical protein HDV03_001816 [Kappamyces sp. JEL0829]|nr:hypothetical protein HDV03_001816 [Kappamyces sp. JEL0829]